MIRVNLNNGSAKVSEQINLKTIKSLNKMAELAKNNELSKNRKAEKFDEIMNMMSRACKENWSSEDIHTGLVRITAYE